MWVSRGHSAGYRSDLVCVCVWCLHAHVCCKAQLVGWKYHLCFISRNIKTWKTIQSIIGHVTKVTNNQENKLLETSLELQCLFVVFRCRLGFGKQMTFSIWCAIIVLDVGIFCDLGNAIFCAFPTVRIYIYVWWMRTLYDFVILNVS